ncbi:MAG: DNA-packaging protein [Roseburia sp.]
MDVNQKELAAILGISDRRIRQLREEYGLFERGITSGKKIKNYCLEKCVPEYINYKLEAETTQGKTIEREKEQAEHEQIKKKISILKLRKMRRELHNAEDVEEFLTNMLMNFRNKLLTIPQKIAPLVVGEDDVNEILSLIEKEVFETLEELSEYDPLKIDHDRAEKLIQEEVGEYEDEGDDADEDE